jgi:hypothetical protein
VVLLLPRGRWKLDESLMKLERKWEQKLRGQWLPWVLQQRTTWPWSPWQWRFPLRAAAVGIRDNCCVAARMKIQMCGHLCCALFPDISTGGARWDRKFGTATSPQIPQALTEALTEMSSHVGEGDPQRCWSADNSGHTLELFGTLK